MTSLSPPILSGAGAATAISQWAAAIPLLYRLNKSIPFNLSQQKGFLSQAVQSYATAGSLIMLRTVAKIAGTVHDLSSLPSHLDIPLTNLIFDLIYVWQHIPSHHPLLPGLELSLWQHIH